MWVVKLGGSLANSANLPPLLDMLTRFNKQQLVLVAGGGLFADHVRHAQTIWHFSDHHAHYMAILAMEQYAWLLHSIQPNLHPARTLADIQKLTAHNKIPLWFPYQMTQAQTDIEESWAMTSDSLAAWLAQQLQASRLILVKSAPTPAPNTTLEQLIQQGIIDPCLPRYSQQIPVTCIHYADLETRLTR
ncbi:putative kinase, aspartokinase/uridylate kinase [Beggiatoa alba B18LD]|uniref:Putative kinase, aspartokinase/uridylate kinase n=1 Tax=Beggiatoa alba B18LD TaxID=395493 RepID=I3CJ07_9GAMM|nr:kinase aspartokinase/uridylate kinase [Beggiatoa alba]EIJ43600.1 putative kinase, aspartokinase/uridylate kinase [Beggiatoa alba B18LD]